MAETHIFLIDRKKYEGIILEETDFHYIVDDIKIGVLKIPKFSAIVMKKGDNT